MKRLIKLFGTIVIFILAVLASEWIHSEIQFQVWLSQDEQRLDFNNYYTPEELKEVLLIKLPVGSSQANVETFMIANGVRYQEPQLASNGKFGISSRKSRGGRGLLGLREIFGGSWMIFFDLNQTDHKLIDINVKALYGP